MVWCVIVALSCCETGRRALELGGTLAGASLCWETGWSLMSVRDGGRERPCLSLASSHQESRYGENLDVRPAWG